MKKTIQTMLVVAALLCSVLAMPAQAAQTTPPVTVAEELLAKAIEDDGALRVLSIGNSYSQDGLYYLNQVFQAENPEYEVEISYLYKGSCSLQEHAERIDGKPAYTYYYFDGAWEKQINQTLEYAVTKSDWDFIALQQNSANSGKPDSYSYLDTLVPYVKEKATNEDVQLLWHMTWPWSDYYKKIGPDGSYASQAAMYQAICSTVQQKIDKDTFAAIVPSGTAVENVGSSHYSYDGLHRDDVHLSNVGRMAAAYTWYSVLTGETVDTNGFSKVGDTYDGYGVPVDMAVVAEAANNAIATPFAVTPSVYTDGHTKTGWIGLSELPATLSAGNYYLEKDLVAEAPITVSGDVALALNGKTLTACAASNGSFITVGDAARLVICESGAIDGADAGETTRGIEVQAGGTLVLDSGVISGFTTSGVGGGVYVNDGAFTMKGGAISGNSAYQGGGVAGRTNAITITGGTIGGTAITSKDDLGAGTGNYASNGGGGMYFGINPAISGDVIICGNYTDGNGGGIRSQASIALKGNVKITDNGAKNNGGGVYGAYKVTVDGAVEISSNTAGGNGGGVAVEITKEDKKDACAFSGGVISNNTAVGNGGGLYLYHSDNNTSTFAVNGTIELTQNTAASGSGIYSAGDDLSVSGDAVIDGQLVTCGKTAIAGGTIDGELVKGDGGSFELTGGKFSVAMDQTTLQSWVTNGKYVIQSKGYYVLVDSAPVPCTTDHTGWIPVSEAANLNVAGGKYYLAADITDIFSDSIKYGINVSAENVTLCMHGHSVVPTDSGAGALRCNAKGFVVKNGSTVGGYLTGKSVCSVLVGNAAGMEMHDNVHISDANIVGGDSIGAAIYVNGTKSDGGVFVMKGGSISNNTITSPSGYSGKGCYGAIELNGATAKVRLEGGEIIGNQIILSTTSKNNASVGGACVINTGVLEIAGDVVISANSGTSNKGVAAGGIYNKGGTLTMSGGTIAGNETSSNGGGVYNEGVFDMTGGTISGNSSSRGDQLYSYNGDDVVATVSGGTITDRADNTTEGIFGASNSHIVIKGDALIDSKIVLNSGGAGMVSISGGKFSAKMTREALNGFLATDAGVLSVQDNTGADAAAYPYVVGVGFQRVGEYIAHKSAVVMGLYLNANLGMEDLDDYCVVLEGANPNVTAGIKIAEGKLLITAQGIAAKEMHDQITFIVKKGDEVMFQDTLSVYDAAKSWVNDGNTADDVMLADMINYGIEAQKQFKYNTETVDALSGGTQTVPQWKRDYDRGVTEGFAQKVGVSLTLEDQIRLNMYILDPNAQIGPISLTDGTTSRALVEGTDYTESAIEAGTMLSFDNISIRDAKKAVSFTVTLSDNTQFDVNYGISDYIIQEFQNTSGDQVALMQALMKYVDSVSAYLENMGTGIVPGEDETDPIDPMMLR